MRVQGSAVPIRDRVKLLNGPYKPPQVKKGERTFCHFRDCDVVVTGWSDGRNRWPRCRALHHRGGSGLLVDAELARTVKTESAAAVKYWGIRLTSSLPTLPWLD